MRPIRGYRFQLCEQHAGPGIKNFQTYIDLQKHIASRAAATGATVLLSNHSEFDNAITKNRMLGRAGHWPAFVRTRGRLGPALFPGNAGLRAGGSAQTGTTFGSISDAVEKLARSATGIEVLVHLESNDSATRSSK